jgi:branched-chain amino acid transport system permease protein
VRPIPTELARLPVVRSGVRRFVFLLGVVVVGFPFVMSPTQVGLGISTMIDGIVIISLVVVIGWGGQISLGQYGIVAVGALIGGALMTKVGLPFGLALVGGALAGAATAVILGLTALRVRGLYLAVTTLAFAVVARTVLLNPTYFDWLISAKVNRPVLLFVHTEDQKSFYFLCVGVLAVAWWAALGLRRTRTGRTLIAARDNERGVQAFGVNLVRTRLVTFALSGFMAAAAGVLLAAQQHGVSADAFPPDASLQIFLTAVIGGLGSIQGALLGALYFAVVNFAIHGAVGRLFASAVGVLIVLLFFPGGLGSLAYRGRDAILRRIAIRRRLYVPSLLADYAAAAAGHKAPLAPRPTSSGVPAEVPARYRQPSRIRVAGTSQSGKGWEYG